MWTRYSVAAPNLAYEAHHMASSFPPNPPGRSTILLTALAGLAVFGLLGAVLVYVSQGKKPEPVAATDRPGGEAGSNPLARAEPVPEQVSKEEPASKQEEQSKPEQPPEQEPASAREPGGATAPAIPDEERVSLELQARYFEKLREKNVVSTEVDRNLHIKAMEWQGRKYQDDDLRDLRYFPRLASIMFTNGRESPDLTDAALVHIVGSKHSMTCRSTAYCSLTKRVSTSRRFPR